MLKTKASQPFGLYSFLQETLSLSVLKMKAVLLKLQFCRAHGKQWQNFYLLLIYFFPNESFFTFNTVFYINNKAVILKQNKKTI